MKHVADIIPLDALEIRNLRYICVSCKKLGQQNTYLPIYMHTYIYTYMHTYIHAYIHTYLYICIYLCEIIFIKVKE